MQVAAARQQNAGSLVQQVVQAFTEDLDVRKAAPSQQTKAELWNDGGLAPLRPLI